MSDSNPLFEAVFNGCAAQVSTEAGVQLTPGEISVATTSETPEGDLAVLPISVGIGPDADLTLWVTTPLSAAVAIARRMRGNDDPDKKEEEASPEDLEGVGELLNSVGGVVNQALRANVRSDLEGRAETWWRTADPGERSFPEGEFVVGTTSLGDPDGTTLSLQLRVPPALLELAGARKRKGPGRVLMGALDDETRKLVEKVVTDAKGKIEAVDLEDAAFLRTCASADCVVLGGETALDRCRQLRLADATWQVSTVLCLEEPTEASVLRALDCGVSHVLRTPCSQAAVENTLRSVWS